MIDHDSLRMPPHSVESEQSLIGGLLLDNSAWDRIADLVSEADFYRDEHRRIFAAIARLIEQGKPADIVTTFELLERSGDAQRVGGLSYIGAVANNTPCAANVRGYAEIVRNHALLRKLGAVGCEIAAKALNPSGRNANQILDESEADVISIREGGAKSGKQTGIAAHLRDAFDGIEAAANGTTQRYSTGLRCFDRALHDFIRGALVIIGGRPGSGKSSLAVGIADAVAGDGQPGAVAFFSMEMPARQVTLRLLSRLSGVDLTRLISGQGLTQSDYAALSVATARLHEHQLDIDDSPALRVADIRARCSAIRRKHGGLKLVVVDYLQLMTGHGETRALEVGSISRGLKALAKELDVPVIALAQLSRKLEDRPNKRPQPSDLRDSGELEQDADLILFAYRDEVYFPDSADRGTAELHIGKQRNGPSGQTVRVAWDAPTSSFRDLPESWAPTVHAVKTKTSFSPRKGFE